MGDRPRRKTAFTDRAIFLQVLLMGVGISLSPMKTESAEKDSRSAVCILSLIREGKDTYSPDEALTAAEIHYQVQGAGHKETIVLVHGLGGDLTTWSEIAPELARKYQVILYDQRGHGLTPARGRNFSSTTLAHDLLVLLDHLGVSKAHVLGHSMGGRTVAKFGALFPERTQSVMIEDMHMIGRRTPLPDNELYSENLKRLPQIKEHSPSQAIFEAEKRVGPLTGEDLNYLGFERDSEGFYTFTHVNPSVPLYESQGLQEDLTSALISIKSPLLFIAADDGKNAVLFGKGIDHLKTHRPDAKVVVISDATHSVHRTQKEKFLDTVNKFLDTETKK